jgi:phage/plasmid-associated DNA primase
MRDRLRLVPFDNYIKPEDQDHKLFENLIKEAPGVLYRLIQEAAACVRDDEFPKCEIIDQTTENYIDAQDTVKMFYDDCIEYSPGEKIQAGTLYAKYETWCKNSDYTPKSNRVFGEEFSVKCEKKRTESGICYMNIRIKEA